MSATTDTLPVVLRPGDQRNCPVCENPGRWIFLGVLYCTPHIGEAMEQAYEADPHPFTPPLPLPWRGGAR